MKDRIVKLMEQEGFSSSQFADAIGIQRAAMSHITTGRNNPSLDVITKILERFPYVNPDWLMRGLGNMRRSDTTHAAAPTEKLPDLFAGASHIRPEEKKTAGVRQETEVKQPVTIVQQAVKETANAKEMPAKKVVRIMVFYSNQTYEAFVPEK
jgi:transcriptional regulator with XRE-family HTH domain